MVAALEMAKLGFACTILEARTSAGGRVRTIRAGDVISETDSMQTCQFDIDENLYFNAGPSRIAQHHELLLGYCRDFGIALETFTNDNRGAWLHSPNAFGGQPQVARTLIADTRGGIARLLSTAINQRVILGVFRSIFRGRYVIGHVVSHQAEASDPTQFCVSGYCVGVQPCSKRRISVRFAVIGPSKREWRGVGV